MKPNDQLWRIVSRGYAAENIDIDGNLLEVYCPEFVGFTDGEITNAIQELSTTGTDDRGHNYTVKISTAATIKCKWKPQGSNRITAPNIRRGERVEVWQYADADVYYWSTTGEDDNLRKLETVTYAYSNTKDENVKELTKENTYNIIISTHQKKVEINTSKSDGEPFAHTLQIDTANGVFTYTDHAGNIIQVNSSGTQIFIENAAGSKYVMDNGNISITAPQTISLDANSVVINAKSMNASAKTVNITGETTVKGNTTMNGGLDVKGAMTHDGTNVGKTHTHGGVERGRFRTDTPR